MGTSAPPNTGTPTVTSTPNGTPAPTNTATVSVAPFVPSATFVPTGTSSATATNTPTNTATSAPTGTPTTTPGVAATATLVPTQTAIPGLPFVPAATATALPVTETPVAVVIVHNVPRTVKGGRATICDLKTNLAALQSGCVILSSISVQSARVVYTLTYPTLPGQSAITQVFTDTADYRGHSLHIFNVPYVPPTGALHGAPATIVQVAVTATGPDGTVIPAGTTRFVAVR